MKRTRLLRAGLVSALACVGAQVYANGGFDPLLAPRSATDGRYAMAVAGYELAVVLAECWLIARLFRQAWKRALIASSLANAASFVAVSTVAVICSTVAHGRLRSADDYVHFYSGLLPVLFALNIATEAPFVLRICHLRFNVRFVACMFLIQIVTWPVGVTLFYPEHLTQSTRSPVSRAKSDMRSYATGIESYFVDNNAYPPAVPMKSYIKTSDADEPWASRLMIPGLITTPIAYLTSYFPDPYGPIKGATFYYCAGAKGWILVSPGPDRKYDIDPASDYNSSETQPSAKLLEKCFDPTNGTTSQGNIFRVMFRDNESSATSAPI